MIFTKSPIRVHSRSLVDPTARPHNALYYMAIITNRIIDTP